MYLHTNKNVYQYCTWSWWIKALIKTFELFSESGGATFPGLDRLLSHHFFINYMHNANLVLGLDNNQRLSQDKI